MFYVFRYLVLSLWRSWWQYQVFEAISIATISDKLNCSRCFGSLRLRFEVGSVWGAYGGEWRLEKVFQFWPTDSRTDMVMQNKFHSKYQKGVIAPNKCQVWQSDMVFRCSKHAPREMFNWNVRVKMEELAKKLKFKCHTMSLHVAWHNQFVTG